MKFFKEITQEHIRTWVAVYVAIINTLMVLHWLVGII